MIVGTRAEGSVLYPLHAMLLAFPIALFSSAAAFDVAYLNTAEMQWSNFAAWMLAGAQVFGGLLLVWAVISAVLARRRGGFMRALIYLGVLAVMWVLGLVNSFHHARDAWSSVGATGLILSILCAVLAMIAGWILHSDRISRETASW
ncbi:MAG: DUF2231 domain-containing protein [Brevundimonas sp.]|uniref:DUF2231 domain-containing protein n=1 Tax=Brevundimonas sp. TaxID=1871086 RepID=UPI00391D7F43